MADVDVNIFSMTGDETPRSGGLQSLRNFQRPRCPPAVVITHDTDTFSVSSINPSVGDSLGSKNNVLGASSLSLTEGRNGVCAGGGPSRSGSPRHSKVHPTDGTNIPRSCSSVAVVSSDGQLPGGESQLDHPEHPIQRKRKRDCCSTRAKRTTCGLFLTTVVCATWIGITHLLKSAYLIHLPSHLQPTAINSSINFSNTASFPIATMADDVDLPRVEIAPYNAPFLTTWICTACNSFFFPAYLCARFCIKRKRTTAKKAFLDAIHRFQEKGLSALHFFTRSMFFCVLWVAANYMLIHSLHSLDATAVMALQSSSASFVYLLSWVILHEQFVGIRIVAVILCNTGIALLAYMDGVSKTSTLGGVVLAAAAAAGLSVHKVLFKKLIGGVTMGQLSLFLTLVGLLNVLLLWPIGLTLYLVQAELLVWTQLPYPQLAGAAALFIVGNVLCNFEVIHSYETFLSLGLVSAVPVSAVLDVYLYDVVFKGMKLAGVLLITGGFLLVLLPDNWPDYITRLLRWRWRRGKSTQTSKPPDPIQPRSRLRASSGNVK